MLFNNIMFFNDQTVMSMVIIPLAMTFMSQILSKFEQINFEDGNDLCQILIINVYIQKLIVLY